MVIMVNCRSAACSTPSRAPVGALARARICIGTCHATMLSLFVSVFESATCPSNMVFAWHPHGQKPCGRNLFTSLNACAVKDLHTFRASNLKLNKVAQILDWPLQRRPLSWRSVRAGVPTGSGHQGEKFRAGVRVEEGGESWRQICPASRFYPRAHDFMALNINKTKGRRGENHGFINFNIITGRGVSED